MATKKRKKARKAARSARLAGSLEHHVKNAGAHAKHTRDDLKVVRRAMESDDCVAAFAALMSGEANLQRYLAHNLEVPVAQAPTDRGLPMKVIEATAEFRKRCVRRKA